MLNLRPRILYVVGGCPYALSSGAQIRGLGIGHLLQECGDVRLVLLQKREFEPAALAKTREEFAVETVMRLERSPIRGMVARLRHELDPWFLDTYGWRLSAADVSKLRQLAAAYDVVWIHGIYTSDSAAFSGWPRSVMDLDDIFSEYHRSALKTATSWKERILRARQIWLWKRRESILLKRFGIVAVCSEADRQCLGANERIHIIPNGYRRPLVELKRCPMQPPRLGFIGTPDYEPNREGILWFIEQVWPRIKQAYPTAQLRLVGVGTDSNISSWGPDIAGLGRIDNTSPEMATWSLSIVPIRIGGGTRVKTVESFSRKCPVVSTAVGAFGYDVKSGDELLLADEPDAFAESCISILRNASLGEQLAQRAWQKYVERWTWSAIKPKVEAAVEHCLSLSRDPSKATLVMAGLLTQTLPAADTTTDRG